MTSDLTPLALPADPAAWEAWFADRCDGQLDRARSLVAEVKGATPDDAAETLRLWNDVNLALGNAFAVASLISQVHPQETIRSRAEKGEQEAHRLLTALGLDRELYDVLARVDAGGLDRGAARVLERSLRDFRRAGVDRDDAVRERIRAMAERETELSQEFSKNIRDDVRAVALDPAQLDGLPEDYVEGHPAGADGKVVITTDYPDYVPFMTFARDRDARAQLLQAFLNRAWPQNDPVLVELLHLRDEHARILGYPDWPSYDAEVKMIGSGPAIPEFIDKISSAAEESARRDYAILLGRLQDDHPGATSVDSTDKAY